MYQKKYIENFTEYQTKQFDANFKKVMRNKLMSFYSYLNYHSKSSTSIKMSIDELTDRWNNKHKKKGKKEKCVCKTTIYNWIKKLQSANLLHINEDSADTFIYTLITENIFLNKKVNKEINTSNCIEPIKNTEFIDSKICDNDKKLVDNIDIDSNTTTAAPIKTNFKKYIEKCNWQYASETMLEVFNNLKVKSNFVKSLVIAKIEKYYWNISKCGAKFYIAKLIKQVQQQCKENFKVKCLNCKNESEQWSYAGQRTYNADELEKGLLGW